jgi:lauroyl/myristoyl acyltransferase
VRQADGKYHITFEKLVCNEKDEHFDNPEMCMTQKYFKFLEKLIIANPEQWLWMHNIWKY